MSQIVRCEVRYVTSVVILEIVLNILLDKQANWITLNIIRQVPA